jgi:hypothetical protein
MTVREIQAFLAEMYAIEVSPDFISTVTDAVHAEVSAWQQRTPEPIDPVVFFDALRVKIRDEGSVRSKAVYLALAILPDGSRDILGIWMEQTEGAKCWRKVFTDLKTRGCQDILIAVTDGLKGMADALAAVYPATPLHRRELATRLVARDSVLCVSAGRPESGLHDQRTGKCPRAAPQDLENPRTLSDRRGRDQTALARAPQHHGDLGPGSEFLAERP